MKHKRFLSILSLSFLATCSLASCGGGDEPGPGPNPDPDPTPTEPTVENPLVVDEITADSEGIKLVAPFTIYTEDGGTPEELEYNTETFDSNVFENMYEAIRVAGANSTNANKLQVQDANHTQIFIRQKASNRFVFDGHDYVGTDSQTACKEYIDSHPDAYGIYGQGSGYAYLGREDYVDEMELSETQLELNAGAYNYMFSKSGVGAGESGQNLNGFSYVTATVRMSEMRYRPASDGDGWNAYIFINLRAGIISDLGLIGNLMSDNTVQWRLVRNCTSTSHGTAGFLTFPEKGIVNQSTKYDAETGEYYGFDDLYFEVCGLSNGWLLNITNLRTGQTYSLDERHYQSDGVTPLVENPDSIYYQALIASSYCPVVGNVWNWDCGAATTNVLWENITMKRYVDDNIETYRNADDSLKYKFTPDSDYLRDGYSQGAFAASHEFGVYEEDGVYASGATYKKGDTYLSQSVSYTNPW